MSKQTFSLCPVCHARVGKTGHICSLGQPRGEPTLQAELEQTQAKLTLARGRSKTYCKSANEWRAGAEGEDSKTLGEAAWDNLVKEAHRISGEDGHACPTWVDGVLWAYENLRVKT